MFRTLTGGFIFVFFIATSDIYAQNDPYHQFEMDQVNPAILKECKRYLATAAQRLVWKTHNSLTSTTKAKVLDSMGFFCFPENEFESMADVVISVEYPPDSDNHWYAITHIHFWMDWTLVGELLPESPKISWTPWVPGEIDAYAREAWEIPWCEFILDAYSRHPAEFIEKCK